MRARVLLVLGAGLILWGCGDDGTNVIPDGGVPDGAVGDGGAQQDAWACLALGDPCAGAGDCCSLSCDLTTNTCSQGTCGLAGTACTVATDCCTLNCVGGVCDATLCTTTGEACADSTDCCTQNCDTGTCAVINPNGSCVTLGNSCTAGSECCSLNCQADRCAPSFVCAPIGDICYAGTDCCTGICTLQSGLTVGTCSSIDVSGVGGCSVAGLPCTGNTECCSRFCVPTSSGVSVCQVTSGCRLQGELCTETADCCPGPDQGTELGTMECVLASGADIGRCRNPNGCVPVGSVCKGGNSAPADCCACDSPKWKCCHPDNSGVWRCAGGSSGPCPGGMDGTPGCCIEPGGQCSYSAECCNGNPCTPDDLGVLRCGATQCVPQGGVCTSTSDCCTGLECIIEPGQTTGTCGTNVPVPDGGIPDGGAEPDAGTCALPGQHCTQSSECCYGYTCYAPGGVAACTSGDTGCTCYTIG
jgi:hypothetical protein